MLNVECHNVNEDHFLMIFVSVITALALSSVKVNNKDVVKYVFIITLLMCFLDSKT